MSDEVGLFGVSHVEIAVADLDRALAFWGELLGFAVVHRGPDHAELAGNGVGLLLCQSSRRSPVTLRLQTTRVDKAAAFLVERGAHSITPAHNTQTGERLAKVADTDGNQLVLWRRLREDELPEPPPLPLTLAWEPAAETLAQALLSSVPVPFRDLARVGLVAAAEQLAGHQEPVPPRLAARGFVRSTPRFQRHRLHAALAAQGFPPESLIEDFAC